MKRAAFLAAGLGLSVNAHLFISSPQPIEGSAPKSPLDASGSNFPCHGVTLPSSGGENMAAGSSQLLAFDTGNGANTAVHGGGSCQISITYETDATKVKDPKNWNVIYSIEGGCPSNTFQNLDSSFSGPQGTYTGSYPCSDPRTNGVDCVNQFNFTIPKGVKDGHAIMAWTWFNNVGNREMYMNCINAQLSGGDGSEMDSFPSMFVANLANVDTCPTTQSEAVLFPNPGKYVTTKLPSGDAAKTAKTFPMATPTGAGCAGDGGSGSGYGSSVASASAAPSASLIQTTVDSQPTKASAGIGPVTVTTMATITGSSGSAPSSVTIESSSLASAVSNAAPVSSASPNSGTGSSSGTGSTASGGCPAGSTPCTESVICIGTTQFGLCNAGCAVAQSLAAGTTCSGGTIMKMRRVRRARRQAGPYQGAY
ncbi:Hypothetical protein R9X50_00679400 [Acrodontium crateriforme]|uniref:Chitin-binding type-4 domain-containing protein n=1 Tax=Acrodontium crateriforme TaxID=150365 RepID=A0AAQ3MC96_9PEZI|nr:Hypothetical protein R9X50_00679400 [Acrodontium crateriforme]